MNAVIMAAIVVGVSAGLMALQVFLSKREAKFPGLIMPIVFLLISFVYPLNMAAPTEGISREFIMSLVFSFVTGNIPTFISLGIYIISRKELNNEK